MEQKDILALVNLNGKCGYAEENKALFRRLALRLLKEVRDIMGLNKSTCDIRYNAGGIAVSGDATLQSDTVYISFNADGLSSGILVRSCKGRKDFEGGENRYFPFVRLYAADNSVEDLAAFATSIGFFAGA